MTGALTGNRLPGRFCPNQRRYGSGADFRGRGRGTLLECSTHASGGLHLGGRLERISGHDLKGEETREETLQEEWARLGRGARQSQGELRGKDGEALRVSER